jgi:cell division septum initiation protein DivIVA
VAKDPVSPVDPDDVIKRSFSTVRRGADPLEVQRYLLELANQLRAGREREADLAAQLRDAEQRATPVDQLDPSRLTALLGEETARVLDAARSAAAEIRANAEESVARMLREARDEAQEMRNEAESVLVRRSEEAEAEVARIRASADGVREQAELDAEGIRAQATARREEAEADADAIRAVAAGVLEQAGVDAAAEVEKGRQEGREMVAEAQRVRQRMLDDLARRRKLLRQQIEQLQAGRDRLAAAYDVVRETLDQATEELEVSLPEAKLAAESAALRATEDDEAVFAAEVEAAAALAHDDAEPGDAPDVPGDEAAEGPVGDTAVEDGTEGIEGEEAVDLVDEVDEVDEAAVEPDTDVPPSASGPTRRAPDPPDGRMSSSVKVVRTPSAERTAAIFARLRDDDEDAEAAGPADTSETTGAAGVAAEEAVAADGGDASTEAHDEADDEATAGDEVLAELEKSLTRRFKRDLSDEQNELLDAVRRQKGTPMAAGTLPPLRDQVERYRALALPVLADAAEAGAERAAGAAAGAVDAPVDDLATGLAEELVLALREQLERCFDEAVGDRDDLADRIRATYRESKAQHVDLPVAAAVLAAASRGAGTGRVG